MFGSRLALFSYPVLLNNAGMSAHMLRSGSRGWQVGSVAALKYAWPR
jgi:hypothetical protein